MEFLSFFSKLCGLWTNRWQVIRLPHGSSKHPCSKTFYALLPSRLNAILVKSCGLLNAGPITTKASALARLVTAAWKKQQVDAHSLELAGEAGVSVVHSLVGCPLHTLWPRRSQSVILPLRQMHLLCSIPCRSDAPSCNCAVNSV